MSKPYQNIPIEDCQEPLIPIPAEEFSLHLPHPYAQLGAPYGDTSPFCLREGVLQRLQTAQRYLQQKHPHWRLQIFDAYRPIAVQQFMVDHTFVETAKSRQLHPDSLTSAQRQEIQSQVEQFWAPPSLDPATPPPHSTGAAVDLTLANEHGDPQDLGSPIDEISPRSYPDYFASSTSPPESHYHQLRLLLREVMLAAGFQQHPAEWWHFSFGDQMWAWLTNQKSPANPTVARYGRVEKSL
jgi:D-alanyl-D-alanine dipeptidase